MKFSWKKIFAVSLVLGAVTLMPWRENKAAAQTIEDWYVVVANPFTNSYQFVWVEAYPSRADAQDLAAFLRTCGILDAVHAIPGKAAFAQMQVGVLDPLQNPKLQLCPKDPGDPIEK